MVEKNLSRQLSKAESIKSLLSTPTNNFGLGLLFKKLTLLSGPQQQEMVSIFRITLMILSVLGLDKLAKILMSKFVLGS